MKKENKEENIKGKKIAIVIIVFLIIVILVASCGALYYNHLVKIEKDKIKEIAKQNSNALLEIEEKIEYGTAVSYDELVEKLIDIDKVVSSKISIFINDIEITDVEAYKFDNVGKYIIKVTLEKEYTYKIVKTVTEKIESTRENEIEVVDTKIPIIIGANDKEITVGDEINLLEGIMAEDEVDGALEVKVEGEVDTKKAGEYTVKAVTEDKNGNRVERDFKVIVKEKEVQKANNSTNNKTNTTSNKTTTNSNTTSTSTVTDNVSNSNTNTNDNSNANKNTNTNNNNDTNDSSTKSGRLNIAKAEAKKVASQIIKSGMNDYQKAEAIFSYLHSNVSLQTNQSTEAYKTNYGNEAYAAFVLKKAACSGFCKAVTLLCDAAGLKSQHVNANQWTHQWNKVLINGEWIILDAQGGFFGGTVHPLEY